MAKVLSRLDILLHANTANYQREIKKATDTTKKELKSVADYGRVMAGHLGTAFATIGSAVSISHIVQTADNMQNLASKIRLATSSADEYKAVQEQLRTISNAQKSSFEGVVDLYSSSHRALSQLGKTQQDVINFTKNMTMAMNIGGGSAQAQAAALTQLGQALASGALRGDEFNSVADQAPVLLDLVAKEMGVATGALRGLAAEGAITSDVVYNAVVKATDSLSDMAGKMPTTVSQGLQVIKNEYNYLVDDIMNQNSMLSQNLANAALWVGEHFRTLVGVGATVGAVWLVNIARNSALATSFMAVTSATAASAKANVANAFSVQGQINAYNALSTRMMLLRMTKTHYINLTTAAITATGGYARSLVGLATSFNTATAAARMHTLAIAGATTAKRGAIGVGILATRAVTGLGGAFAAVGRIILAHPIMTIAAVISAVIVRTMGLQKAMESLSDAVGIVGSMLGDLIDVGIEGFKWLGGVVDRFFSGFMSEGKQSTGVVGKYFGWLFEGTEDGFVGLLQVIARVADKFVGFFYAATRAIYRNMVSLWNSLKQGFADAFNSVSKTVETSINAVLDTYDKVIGKVNGLIRDAKAAASVVGLDGLVPNERATIGYRVKAITLNPTPTKNIGGSLTQDWQGFNHVSNYVDGTIVNQNALKNQDSLANSVDGLAKSLDKAKGVNDAAAKAGKSLTDAHKNQQQQVDKTSDAYEKLVEAYNSKMLDWQKAMWENQHVKAGLEVEKIEWEFTADGGFAKASNTIKNNLRLQALELDRSNAIKEIQAKTREIERSHLEFGTAYEEIMAGIHDETNKLSALLRDVGVEAANLDDITEIVKNAQSSLQADGSVDLGQTQLIIHRWQALQKFKADSISELKKLATAEVNAAELATHKTLDELDLQLESLGSQSELARQLLTIDNERNASIKKYSRMIDHIKSVDGELAKSLKDRVTANADLIAEKNTELVVTQAYQNIVSELKTDEQKRLDTLKEQLDVLGKMAQIDPGKTDQSLGMANDLLGKQLGLDQPVQNGLFGAMQSQRSAYDSKIEQAKQWYKYLQDIFAHNESALTSIARQEEETRLAIRKQYQQAQIEMTLTTSEQIFGHLADSAKAAWGEQSSTYRTMFATQKAFTIVQAMLSVYKAVSQAFATGLTPYDRAANAASAMVEGFKLVAMIRQIQSPVVGQAHDGIMSVPKSGTWNLEKGERVLPKHTAQNLDNTLNRLQGNGNKAIVNVKIENYTGASVQQTTDDDGNIRVIVGQELAKQLPAHVNNPNSEFNRSLKNNYQLQRRF